MSTSAALLTLLNYQADINYYTTEQIRWTNLYNSNEKALSKLQGYETKWYDAYDKACAAESDIKIGDTVYVESGDVDNEKAATAYANAKVTEFVDKKDELDRLEDLDIEYDTMKTLYDTMLEEKQAQYDALKEKVSQEAQDTKLLGS